MHQSASKLADEPAGDVPNFVLRIKRAGTGEDTCPIGNFMQLPIRKDLAGPFGLDVSLLGVCGGGDLARDYCAGFHSEEDTCLCRGMRVSKGFCFLFTSVTIRRKLVCLGGNHWLVLTEEGRYCGKGGLGLGSSSVGWVEKVNCGDWQYFHSKD